MLSQNRLLKLIIGYVLIQDKSYKAKEECVSKSAINVQTYIVITSTIFRLYLNCTCDFGA